MCPCRLRFVSSMVMVAYPEFLVTASKGVRSGEAYTHVPTCRSARVAATASVGPGAGCHC